MHSLGCLNKKLKQQVDKVNPVGNIAPVDAKSSDTKTGVVNIPGVQQQYGKNFGNSVIPFRPGQPVFNSPIGLRRWETHGPAGLLLLQQIKAGPV